MYVCTIIITHINVCLLNKNDSEKHKDIYKRNLFKTT